MAPPLVNQFPPLLGWLLCMLISMERRPATAERNPIYIYIYILMFTCTLVLWSTRQEERRATGSQFTGSMIRWVWLEVWSVINSY